MKVIERNESLLMSVPTAAGKTVVAYNALMKAVSEGKKGIFLVPLRALAWEKVNELKDICSFPQSFKLTGSYGDKCERLGRSVPPNMMKNIVKTLKKEIFNEDS